MKSMVITAFDRPELLALTLESIRRAQGLDQYKVLMILQKGNLECEKIVNTNRDLFNSILITDPSGVSIDSKITNNRILGFYIGFEFWKSDYVISIEDDTSISQDSLKFVDYSYDKYKRDYWFRGVNLGSTLQKDLSNKNSYSLLRFGIHGPASMITKRTWNMMNIKRIMKYHERIFDAQFEFVVKTGFMVTPNVSRFYNRGFIGAHSNNSDAKKFYDRINQSFQNIAFSEEHTNYYKFNIDPKWRKDCILFRRRDFLIYWLKAKVYPVSYRFPQSLRAIYFLRLLGKKLVID